MAKQPVKVSGKKSKTLFAVYSVMLIAAIAFGAFFFVKYVQLDKKYAAIPSVKNQETIASVAKLIDLPKDETPTMYEIKDKTKATITPASKDFYAKAENGDIVLVYTKANQAVLYRPSTKKVVIADKADKLSTISVAIIAPTEVQEKIAQDIQSKYANVAIVSKTAPKVAETQSYVVDTTGSNSASAQDLASKLGITVASLAPGETKPDGANFIVVVAPAAQ